MEKSLFGLVIIVCFEIKYTNRFYLYDDRICHNIAKFKWFANNLCIWGQTVEYYDFDKINVRI